MKNSKGISALVWVVVVIVAAYLLVNSGLINFSTQSQPNPSVGDCGQKGCSIAAQLFVGGWNPLSSALVNVNVELWSGTPLGSGDIMSLSGPVASSPGVVVGETNANAVLQSVNSNLPNTFSGFLMVGNDDFVSSTDRGTEYYYRMSPISWTNKQGVLAFPTKVASKVPTFQEGTLTYTFYDSGTSQTTPNVTIGSGATVTSEEVRIQTAASTAYGNPQLLNPIAMCTNQSTNQAAIDYFRPTTYSAVITAPRFLSAGKQILNSLCYVLPASSLIDNAVLLAGGDQSAYAGNAQAYRYFVTVKALAGVNPGVSDNSYIMHIDKTFFKDDLGNWQAGFGYDSLTGSSKDVGSDDLTSNTLKVNFT